MSTLVIYYDIDCEPSAPGHRSAALLPGKAAGGAGGAGGRTLARRLLEEQRPRYQAAREALAERRRLLSRVDADALALPPGV